MICILCKEQNARYFDANGRITHVSCISCGDYKITAEACSDTRLEDDLLFQLACWVSQQSAFGIVPVIKSDTIEWITSYKPPDTRKRAELYLGKVIRAFDGLLMGVFQCTDRRFRVASWSVHESDCVAIARYLASLGALERPPSAKDTEGSYMLTVKGHLLYEEMVDQRASGSQAFVAMWFDTKMDSAYRHGIEPAVQAAGYEPLRVDQSHHTGKVDDRIIAELRRSAFVVADFTGHRGGVYYEAGFAHGLAKQVVFTCREDMLATMHFDVRQYNTIVWAEDAELKGKLQNRLLALFGAGPLNPEARPILLG